MTKTKAQLLEETRAKVVDILRQGGPMGPAEVARVLGKDRCTVHKHLAALSEQGRVVRKSATRYVAAGD